jgi:hypothetical protein
MDIKCEIGLETIFQFGNSTHHAEGLVDPNSQYKKTVTGFRYPRACRFRKYQLENRSDHGSSLNQLFSKRDFNS